MKTDGADSQLGKNAAASGANGSRKSAAAEPGTEETRGAQRDTGLSSKTELCLLKDKRGRGHL